MKSSRIYLYQISTLQDIFESTQEEVESGCHQELYTSQSLQKETHLESPAASQVKYIFKEEN